jgi:hypothetical protein
MNLGPFGKIKTIIRNGPLCYLTTEAAVRVLRLPWPAPEFGEQALAVVQANAGTGPPPESARRMARLVQAYELSFWNTLAEDVE